MEKKFFEYLTRFCQNHNTQNSLLGPNNGSKFRVIIIDVPKPFDIVIGMIS